MHLKFHGCTGLKCVPPPQKTYSKSQCPGPQNVTVFEDVVLKEGINLKEVSRVGPDLV